MMNDPCGILEEFAERATWDLGQFIEAGLSVWRKDNPIAHQARNARWYQKNKDKKREANRLWRMKNPGYSKAYHERARSAKPGR